MNGNELVDKLRISDDVDWSRYDMPPSEVTRVRDASTYLDDVLEALNGNGAEVGTRLPWSKTHGKINLRSHELSVWAGVNGHGKSLLLSQVILGALAQGDTACIASMEMTPRQTLVRMSKQAIGGSHPAEDRVTGFFNWLHRKLWMYDQIGTVDAEKLLCVVRYAREELGVTHFVIDSLMKCGMGVDDYNGQKRFVDKLSTYAKDSGVHIHLVAHARKGEKETTEMDKFDVKGAGEILDMADNGFVVHRNKRKEAAIAADDLNRKLADDKRAELEAQPDAVLSCHKQRHGEWEGKIGLYFYAPAQQYTSRNNGRPIERMLEQ